MEWKSICLVCPIKEFPDQLVLSRKKSRMLKSHLFVKFLASKRTTEISFIKNVFKIELNNISLETRNHHFQSRSDNTTNIVRNRTFSMEGSNIGLHSVRHLSSCCCHLRNIGAQVSYLKKLISRTYKPEKT